MKKEHAYAQPETITAIKGMERLSSPCKYYVMADEVRTLGEVNPLRKLIRRCQAQIQRIHHQKPWTIRSSGPSIDLELRHEARDQHRRDRGHDPHPR